MRRTVAGVGLGDIKDIIPEVLRSYREVHDGILFFDVDAATDFTVTPDKPNFARSRVGQVRMLGHAANIIFIAFQPGDGTGDTSTNTRGNIASFNGYPAEDLSLPRSKRTTGGEAHLTIGAFRNGSPVALAGTLDLVGIQPVQRGLVRLGSLGQTPATYEEVMRGAQDARPTVTYTVKRYQSGETFGGEHSVVNVSGELQVCAFVSVGADEDPFVIHGLRAQLPVDS